MVMGIVAWIVLGLTAGYIASILVNNRSEGFLFNTLLGMIGALIGGWMVNAFGIGGVTSFSIWSILVAMAGAVIFLIIWHAVRRSPAHS